jgi:hypothetical protein
MFIGDSIRLLLMGGALFAAAWEGQDGGAPPLLLFAAPNVLFPLAALLLWLRPEAYGAYLPLYLAGKITAAAANLCWIFYSAANIAQSFMTALMLRNIAVLAVPAAAVLLLLFDGLSIAGALRLLYSNGPSPGAGQGGGRREVDSPDDGGR